MNDLATLLVGIPVAALAAIDIWLRLRDGHERKETRGRLAKETDWLRQQCREALSRAETRTSQAIDGRHAGRGTFHSGMRANDADDARAWFVRTREMVKTADSETLRSILFALEPAPRLPLASPDIWRDLSSEKIYNLAEQAQTLVRDELKRRNR